MNTTTTHTAILVFTRTANEEAVCKVLTKNQAFNTCTSVTKRIIDHTLQATYNTGSDVFTIDSPKQKGDSFGERLTNAIEDIFSKGYDNLIVTGTDTPDITTEHFDQTSNLLLSGKDFVIGPSADGGVYIIGLSKKAYQRDKLINIAWETSSVKTQLAEYSQQSGCLYAELDTLRDLDSGIDLREWLSRSNSELSFIIRDIIKKKLFISSEYRNILIFNKAHFIIQRRGPPCTFHFTA